MSKENNVMGAIVKLAVCQGNADKCMYRGMCAYSCFGATCAEQLHKDCDWALDGLKERCVGAMPEECTPAKYDLAKRVTNVLREVGIPASLKGYNHIREAIILCVNDTRYVEALTKELYPAIAEKFGSTPSRVERAIRHAIEVAWDRGDLDTLQRYFGYTVSSLRGKPTNGEFISLIADNLRLEMSDNSTK